MYRFITGVVALGLAACAAYFSVIGIASLMGANFWQVAVMAGFLEAGKLVCASAAYRFRKVAPRWIRGLFITFTGVMMLITSLGIFGFLSSSYQKAASERDINQQQVENVESKLQTFKSEVDRLKEDRQRLISEQQELQQTRAEQGWLSKRQDQRLSNIPADLSETDSALTASRDSVLSLQSRITNLESSQNEEAKLGPIIFVANTVGLPEDSAALYFIMLLIFVFDPMAVTLVVALSMATDFEETVTEEPEKQESDGERILDYDPTGKRPDPQEIRETLGKPLPDSEENSDDEKEINLTAGKIDTDKLRDLSSQDAADEEKESESEEESEPFSKTKLDPYSQGVVDNATQTAESILKRRKKDGSDTLSLQKNSTDGKEINNKFDQRVGQTVSLDESVQEVTREKEKDEKDPSEKFFSVSDKEKKKSDTEGNEQESEPVKEEYKQWLEEAQSKSSQVGEKPWKNPFKAPYNS